MNMEQYFGLSEQPFPKAANKQSLLMNPAMENVLARLRFALERDTIALLVAESGCGKSIALSLFAQSLDASNYHVLTTSLTTLKPFSFIAHIAANLGLPGKRFKGETAAALIMQFRSQPRRTVILVDEAHLLPDSSIEDLRLLTADNLDRSSPFSLVLVGQPLLKDRITEPQHYAMWQRIGVRLRLRPLTQDEVSMFIKRYLKAAGSPKEIFTPDAVAEIFTHSRGIPRLIKNIAIEAMSTAMSSAKDVVDADVVSQAIIDMESI